LADTVAKVENRTTPKISRSRFLDADAVLYLASDRSSCVNGDEITVDGSYANMLMNLVPRPGFE
jgi:enoyl-[acyl-carrier-protein] reductase (NADH)